MPVPVSILFNHNLKGELIMLTNGGIVEDLKKNSGRTHPEGGDHCASGECGVQELEVRRRESES